ncbi:MAG: 5'-nucleotidase [Thiobacillus sp.]
MSHSAKRTMSTETLDKLVIAISSRALFDLDASHRVFVQADTGLNIIYIMRLTNRGCS